MDGRLTGIALTQTYISASIDDLDLRNSLDHFAQTLAVGDLSQVESMLASQAVALQGMFTDLALRAHKASSLQAQQVLLQLALKAQSNGRATLEALINIKQPKQVAFVRQANVAHTQQVNNGVASSHVGNEAKAPTN